MTTNREEMAEEILLRENIRNAIKLVMKRRKEAMVLSFLQGYVKNLALKMVMEGYIARRLCKEKWKTISKQLEKEDLQANQTILMILLLTLRTPLILQLKCGEMATM